jgi:cytochrome c oxidase subunit 1
VPAHAGASNGGAAGDDEGGHGAEHGIHLPSPSYWPFVAAVGLPVIGYGALFSWWLVGIGFVIALIGFYGWALEPSVASEGD